VGACAHVLPLTLRIRDVSEAGGSRSIFSMTSSTKRLIDVESRLDVRAPLLATALLSKDGEALGHFHVVNLSAGGALLRGNLHVPLGETMEVLLRLPWTPPIRTAARLIRVDIRHGQEVFAIAFDTLSAQEGDVIHSAVVHLLRKARSSRVLVVTEQDLEVCHSFVLSIEDLGCPAIVVTSPSEALRLLEDTNAIRVVIFDERLQRANAPDFCAHLAKQHAKIRRVLLSDPSTGDAASPRIGMHAVLTKPCTSKELATALGLSPASSPT